LLISCLCAFWVGCTPQKRYQTLSFFFDGVPDPSKPVDLNASSAAQLNPGRAPLAHQHKPFAQGNCTACHGPDKKKIDIARVTEACSSCHQDVAHQYPVMHGPVATGECLWCHLPHESAEPNLLITSSQKLCIQCHDSKALPPNPPEHLDTERNCLDCHFGHGGPTDKYLKPNDLSTTLPSHGGAS